MPTGLLQIRKHSSTDTDKNTNTDLETSTNTDIDIKKKTNTDVDTRYKVLRKNGQCWSLQGSMSPQANSITIVIVSQEEDTTQHTNYKYENPNKHKIHLLKQINAT